MAILSATNGAGTMYSRQYGGLRRIRLALGPVQMVLQSIHDYMRAHDGEPPVRIELHPAVLDAFEDDLQRHYVDRKGAHVIQALFHMVPVVPHPHVEQPRLVTRSGGIRYL